MLQSFKLSSNVASVPNRPILCEVELIAIINLKDKSSKVWLLVDPVFPFIIYAKQQQKKSLSFSRSIFPGTVCETHFTIGNLKVVPWTHAQELFWSEEILSNYLNIYFALIQNFDAPSRLVDLGLAWASGGPVNIL